MLSQELDTEMSSQSQDNDKIIFQQNTFQKWRKTSEISNTYTPPANPKQIYPDHPLLPPKGANYDARIFRQPLPPPKLSLPPAGGNTTSRCTDVQYCTKQNLPVQTKRLALYNNQYRGVRLDFNTKSSYTRTGRGEIEYDTEGGGKYLAETEYTQNWERRKLVAKRIRNTAENILKVLEPNTGVQKIYNTNKFQAHKTYKNFQDPNNFKNLHTHTANNAKKIYPHKPEPLEAIQDRDLDQDLNLYFNKVEGKAGTSRPRRFDQGGNSRVLNRGEQV